MSGSNGRQLSLIYYPHPTLRYQSKPLRRVDAELRRMVAEMFDIMYEHEGIGLAANQVDLPYRLFVLNLTGDPAAKSEELVLINPVILRRKGSKEESEGCLSLPGIRAPVVRAAEVIVRAYNLAGEEIQWRATDLAARAVQHELDHLDGVLFIDRLAPPALEEIQDQLADLVAAFGKKRSAGMIADDQQIKRRLRELEAART